MLTSHMHMLGKRFQIKIVGGARDGELVYESTDWEHPQTLTFTTPIVLRDGAGAQVHDHVEQHDESRGAFGLAEYG